MQTLNNIISDETRLSLCGEDWTLEGYLPDSHTFNMEVGKNIGYEVGTFIPALPARVPSGVHALLQESGLIDEPIYMDNHLKCEWVENKCWLYKKSFNVEKSRLGKGARLVFLGLNFRAVIYLNGKKIGSHQNVHTPFICEVGQLLCEDNEVMVLLGQQADDNTQFGSTSLCEYQTQRFGYSWDFCTRMIGVGIHKDVFLHFYETAVIRDVNIETDSQNGTGEIKISAEFSDKTDYALRVCFKGETLFEFSGKDAKKINHAVQVNQPELWYPLGYGSQPLYDVELSIFHNGKIQDKRSFRVGIRSLTYLQNENSAEDSLCYTPVINGKKIWLKGVNFLPMGHILGEFKASDYDKYFRLLKECNINLVRLWGGGIYENEYFYDLCDKYGILVWQDFTQSNSGIDGAPSMLPQFLDELKKSTEHIVKSIRHRPSTVFYVGGNELRVKDSNPRKAVDSRNPNIAILKNIVETLDGKKAFHPSSPSGPTFDNVDSEQAKKARLCHNVHGPWVYCGTTYHYTKSNTANFCYQGEFGASGASEKESMLRFFDEKTANSFANPDYHWHARNITFWDNLAVAEEMFGKIDSLEKYIFATQFIQAESIRYTVESNRRRAFECSGNNIWTFNEPFPNPNCGNIVDYFKVPKMAYFFTRTAYSNVSASLSYDSLCREKSVEFSVYAQSLGKEYSGELVVEAFTLNKELFCKKYDVKLAEDRAQNIDSLSVPFDGDCVFVRLKICGIQNCYVFGGKVQPLAQLFNCNPEVRATIKNDCVELVNLGNEVAPFVYAMDLTGEAEFEDNYIVLRGGEKAIIRFKGSPKEIKVRLFGKDII